RGSGEIPVNFDWGAHRARCALQLQSSIGEILGSLPPGTTMQVRRMDPTVFPVIAYSVTSKTESLAALRDIAQYQIRPVLTSVNGVARIEVTGGAEDEFEVAV